LQTRCTWFQHRFPERLVTNLHIGQVQIGEHVAEGGEEAVAKSVPIIQHSVRFADETAAVDDIGLALDDGPKEFGIVVRIVFQVRVLNEYDISGGDGETIAQGRSLALIDGLLEQADLHAGKKSAGSSANLAAVPSREQSLTQMISRVNPCGRGALTTMPTSF